MGKRYRLDQLYQIAAMKIALMIYGGLDTLTGGFIYDKMLVDHLRGRGVSVEVVSLPWRRYLPALGTNYSIGPDVPPKDADLVLQDQLIAPSVFRFNRTIAPPVVAIVHQVHSAQPRSSLLNALYRTVERAYYRTIQGAIFNSRFTQTTTRQRLGFSGPATVAYPGKDRLNCSLPENLLRTRCFEKGALKLVFLGNVTNNKGLLKTIRTLDHWPPERWRLTVIGDDKFDPPYARQIKAFTKRKHLADNVTFTGPLEGKRLEAELISHQVLVLPFTMEGFGMAYLEGMGYGLPAVGSTLGAAGEIIEHGKTGFLVAPTAPGRLINHLQTIYDDREKLLAMSLAARQRFESHPRWEESMNSIYQFLRTFIEK